MFAVVATLADRKFETEVKSIGEYYALVVAMVIGMVMMAAASDLLMIFLAMELVSLTAYILSGYFKRDARSSEAALKYLVYGAVSSGLMLYGFSLIYGMTAETNILKISMALADHGYDPLVMILATLLIMAGFGYKIGAFPSISGAPMCMRAPRPPLPPISPWPQRLPGSLCFFAFSISPYRMASAPTRIFSALTGSRFLSSCLSPQ